VRIPAIAAAALGVGLLPLAVTSKYQLHLVIMAAIFAILTMGLNLIYGYVGQLSLGHTAFFGIGAYTSALLALRLELGFGWTLLAAAGLAGLAGAFIGHITLRLREAYFVIVTLSFSEIIYLVVVNWVDFTGGPMGLPGVPSPAGSLPGVGAWEVTSKVSYYYLTIAVLLPLVLIVYRMIRSPIGTAFVALRENEDLAASVGISAYRYAMIAFVTGAAFAGLGGSLYAHYVGFISPEVFTFHYMIMMLIMAIIGGLGTISGPIVGSVLFTLLSEYLRVAEKLREPIFGAILMVSIIFMPQGIVPLAGRLWRALRRGRFETP
jgi:branched-chain amino acid transport system permease protein